MTILERLEGERLLARKSKDSKALLVISGLIGDIQRASDTNTDEVSISVMKKTVANINGTIHDLTVNNHPDADARIHNLKYERDRIESYLPTMLTYDELAHIVRTMLKDGLKLPQIMKKMKEDYLGRYDGKDVRMLIENK